MTALKGRHERFRRSFIELAAAAGAAGAARAAGYSPNAANRAGYRLLCHPRVARRVAEIEAETARPHGGGDAVPIGKLETAYRRAIVGHQFDAADRASAGSDSAPFVNFCYGGKSIDFNAVGETAVYFCIYGRKGHPRKNQENQELGLQRCSFLYTFVYPKRLAATGFVPDQRLRCHGSATVIHKKAPEVSKRYTRPKLRVQTRLIADFAADSGSKRTTR